MTVHAHVQQTKHALPDRVCELRCRSQRPFARRTPVARVTMSATPLFTPRFMALQDVPSPPLLLCSSEAQESISCRVSLTAEIRLRCRRGDGWQSACSGRSAAVPRAGAIHTAGVGVQAQAGEHKGGNPPVIAKLQWHHSRPYTRALLGSIATVPKRYAWAGLSRL